MLANAKRSTWVFLAIIGFPFVIVYYGLAGLRRLLR
jgi:hypothetical protein